MKQVLLLLLFTLPTLSWADLPWEYFYEWTENVYEIPQKNSGVLDITSIGTFGDTGIDISADMKQLFVDYPEYDSIYFPAGIYSFNSRLEIPSGKTIYGEGTQTVFVFNVENSPCVSVTGAIVKTIELNRSVTSNTTTFSLNAKGLKVGQTVRITSDDTGLVTSNWAKGSVLEWNKITFINSDSTEITLENPLTRDRPKSDNPKIIVSSLASNVELSSIKIIRIDPTESQTSNILLSNAENCKLSCIESESTNFAHIDIRFSRNIEVSGSYMHGAHAFGGGGQGYGVVLQFGTTNCVVSGNIFDTLRHSILLQAGAHGNVISGNYSANPFWTDVLLPEDSAGDLVLHGNWVHRNLFQHNIVQNIVIDNSHGMNGPYNTFFRNRAENYGLFMNNNPASDNQIFIGNEITGNGFLKGLFNLAGDQFYVNGNIVKGGIVPENGEIIDLPASLTDGTISDITKPWIGDITNYPYAIIPSEKRYLKEIETLCEFDKVASVIPNKYTPSNLETIDLRSAIEITKDTPYKLINIVGKEFKNFNKLSNGIYFLNVKQKTYKFFIQK